MTAEAFDGSSAMIGPAFAPRRLSDSGGDDIAHESLELLERLRVDIGQLRSSVDRRERTERAMATRAARLIAGNGFFFVPMATAPLVGLRVRDCGARSAPRLNSSAPAAQTPPPEWNASTLLDPPGRVSPVRNNRTSSVQNNWTSPVRNNPTSSVQNNPTSSAQNNRTPSAQNNPTSSVQNNRTPSVRNNPTSSVRNNPTSSAQNNRTPSARNNPTSPVRNNPTSSVQNNRTPSAQNNPTSSAQNNRTPSAQNNPTSPAQYNRTSPVQDNWTSPAQSSWTSRAQNNRTSPVQNSGLGATRKQLSNMAKGLDVDFSITWFPCEDENNDDGGDLSPVTYDEEVIVRDLLRRLYITARDPPDSADRIDDEVLNGIALRRLVALALGGRCPPLRPPRTMDDARRHYVAALSALRGAAVSRGLCLPPGSFLLRPEAVLVRGETHAFFALLRAVLCAVLPPLSQSLSELSLCLPRAFVAWPAREDMYTPAATRALELSACAFLSALGALPDPSAHSLPPDAAPVPAATAAPFLPRGRVARQGVPPALFVPGVFPFLTNGTALCDAAARLTGAALPVHRNPRVRAACVENVEAALGALRACGPARVSPMFLGDAGAVVDGDRRVVLLLLEDMMRLADAAPPRRTAPRPGDAPYKPLASTTQAYRSEAQGHEYQSEAQGHEYQREVQGHEYQREVQSPAAARVPVQRSPAAVAEGVRHCVIASPLSAAALTAAKRRSGAETARVAGAAATTATTATARGDGEALSPADWLRAVLGADFRYGAADGSFAVAPREPLLREDGSLIFSDGVVLAHLIRTLERRRCAELGPIEAQPRAVAAKRRNIRKCLSFLQTERRTLIGVPLLDERLLAGELESVLHVIQCLRIAYRFAVRE